MHSSLALLAFGVSSSAVFLRRGDYAAPIAAVLSIGLIGAVLGTLSMPLIDWMPADPAIGLTSMP